MIKFKVSPIANELADSIRLNMKDNLGGKKEVSVAGESGYGPCRSCLKRKVLFISSNISHFKITELDQY